MNINNTVDKLIEQNEEIIDRIHGSVKSVHFSENMGDKTIELVRMHLGYLKNFADLAKTKLLYNRYDFLLTNENKKGSKGRGSGTRRKKA